MNLRFGLKEVMVVMAKETELTQPIVHRYITSFPKYKAEIIMKAYELEMYRPSLNRHPTPSWYHHGVKYEALIWSDCGTERVPAILKLNISSGGDEIWFTQENGKIVNPSAVIQPYIK